MQIIFLTKGRIKLRLRMGTTFDILGTQKTPGKNYLSKTVDFYHKGLSQVYLGIVHIVIHVWLLSGDCMLEDGFLSGDWYLPVSDGQWYEGGQHLQV